MHHPVLLEDVLEGLALQSDGRYVDGTAGGGGHAEAIAARLGREGRLLAMDCDPEAVVRVRDRLRPFGDRCRVISGNFRNLSSILTREGWPPVDGILLDLGMSSFQVDDGARGFSFQKDGALDMRMNPNEGPTAADVLRTWAREDLVRMLRENADERSAWRIVDAVMARRDDEPVTTTAGLRALIHQVKGGRRGATDPATKTFQALRMCVNDELGAAEAGVEAGIQWLRPGGRLAVITFHSAEDRVVKRGLRAHEERYESLPAGGQRQVGRTPLVRRVNRKPIVPGDDAIRRNPRARSAKLRIVEAR